MAGLLLLAACKEPNAPSASAPPAPAPTVEAPQTRGATSQGGQTLCNIESIDGKLLGAESATLRSGAKVQGWLGDDSGQPVRDPVMVIANESGEAINAMALQLGTERKDVAAAYPAVPGLEKAGFELHFADLPIAPGRYRIYLRYLIGGEIRLCDNGRRIDIPEKS